MLIAMAGGRAVAFRARLDQLAAEIICSRQWGVVAASLVGAEVVIEVPLSVTARHTLLQLWPTLLLKAVLHTRRGDVDRLNTLLLIALLRIGVIAVALLLILACAWGMLLLQTGRPVQQQRRGRRRWVQSMPMLVLLMLVRLMHACTMVVVSRRGHCRAKLLLLQRGIVDSVGLVLLLHVIGNRVMRGGWDRGT